MRTIKATVTLKNVEQWSVDWDNESEKSKELKALKKDIKDAINAITGMEFINISIELDMD